jgi:hypothetical protein
MEGKEIKKVLSKIEWKNIHSCIIFDSWGDCIQVKTDGVCFACESGEIYQANSEIIGTIKIKGYGNIDNWDYLGGIDKIILS